MVHNQKLLAAGHSHSVLCVCIFFFAFNSEAEKSDAKLSSMNLILRNDLLAFDSARASYAHM